MHYSILNLSILTSSRVLMVVTGCSGVIISLLLGLLSLEKKAAGHSFPSKAERSAMTPSPVSNNADCSYDLLWFCFSPADEFQMKALPVLSAWTVFNWLLQCIKCLLWLNSLWNGIKLFLSVCSLSGRQIT